MTLVALHAQRLSLTDGTRIAIRTLQPSDGERLRTLFDSLSAESRFNRFHAFVSELTPTMCTHLSNVDHNDRAALIAFEADDVLEARPIAVARFYRLHLVGRPDAAELAITVADDFQRRGFGTLLLEELAATARDCGITTFVAHTLSSNRGMLRLLELRDAVPTSSDEHERSFELSLIRLESAPQPPASQLLTLRKPRERYRSPLMHRARARFASARHAAYAKLRRSA
jgi:GNAT superfamily N-acetyltransferase